MRRSTPASFVRLPVASDRSRARMASRAGDASTSASAFDACDISRVDDADLASIRSRIAALTAANGVDGDEGACAREEDEAREAFVRTLERYRERATLLDPTLASLVEPLVSSVARVALEDAFEERVRALTRCCEALDAISSVRGWKTCVRFYPNAAKYLEPAVRLLKRAREWEGKAGERTAWQVERVVLVWVSHLVLVPFDLATIDSQADVAAGVVTPGIVRDLMRECEWFLGDPGACRDVAGIVLAKLVTRPDMRHALRDFTAWASAALRGHIQGKGDVTFLVPGVLRALAAVYKFGEREHLLEFAESCWHDALHMSETKIAEGSTLVRQLSIKLASRVGLVFLRPRVISWRYDRGSRRLEDNLKRGDTTSTTVSEQAEVKRVADEHEDAEDVHVAVDDIVEMCLRGLRDSETVVRWTSAKALGRIAARLPLDFADEIVGAVMDCLSVIESDSTWHGACLALAELARRGLLLPTRLSEAVPRCVDALMFDVRRGAHSVGAHVRDAAAYVCWAFARAYAPKDFEPYVSELAPTLLMVACFDREVNCRRAASAAFQEAVGRLGRFPHGIDIVTVADYHALGSKIRAALEVAPFICGFDEYRRPLLEHVLDHKLIHWERSTRQLAARAIGVLGGLDVEWVAEIGLQTVISRITSSDLPTRHGAVLALGEMMLVAHEASMRFSDAVSTQVVDLVRDIADEKMLNGKGGEIMRSANCRLIECMALSLSSMRMNAQTRDSLLEIVEESLKSSSNDDVQFAASDAVRAFAARRYGPEQMMAAYELLIRHVKILEFDPSDHIRRGSALVLGGLPSSILLVNGENGVVPDRAPARTDFSGGDTISPWRNVIQSLIVSTRANSEANNVSVETRVRAVHSLAEVSINILYAHPSEIGSDDVNFISEHVLNALVMCLEDYSADNRGDVGSWVREASLKVIPAVVGALQSRTRAVFTLKQITNLISVVLKQTFEKIDRMRFQSLTTLIILIRGGHAILHGLRVHGDVLVQPLIEAPGSVVLESCLPATIEDALDASNAAVLFQRLSPILGVNEYAYDALSGWFLSVGAVGESLVRFATDALVRAIQERADLVTVTISAIVGALRTHKHVDRVTIPVLRVCDALISRGVIDSVHPMALEVVDAIRAECFSSRDIPKLITGSACLTHFIRSDNAEVHRSAATGSLALMVNRFPRVRAVAAEHAYTALLALSEPSAEDEVAIELLSSNAWDAPPSATKELRLRLYELLGLDLPSFMLEERRPKISQRRLLEDENSSYASLVGDTGY